MNEEQGNITECERSAENSDSVSPPTVGASVEVEACGETSLSAAEERRKLGEIYFGRQKKEDETGWRKRTWNLVCCVEGCPINDSNNVRKIEKLGESTLIRDTF